MSGEAAFLEGVKARIYSRTGRAPWMDEVEADFLPLLAAYKAAVTAEARAEADRLRVRLEKVRELCDRWESDDYTEEATHAAHDIRIVLATADAVERDSTCPPSSSDANTTTVNGAATSSLSTASVDSEPRSTSDNHPDRISDCGGRESDRSADSTSGSGAATSGRLSQPSFTGEPATSSEPYHLAADPVSLADVREPTRLRPSGEITHWGPGGGEPWTIPHQGRTEGNPR